MCWIFKNEKISSNFLGLTTKKTFCCHLHNITLTEKTNNKPLYFRKRCNFVRGEIVFDLVSGSRPSKGECEERKDQQSGTPQTFSRVPATLQVSFEDFKHRLLLFIITAGQAQVVVQGSASVPWLGAEILTLLTFPSLHPSVVNRKHNSQNWYNFQKLKISNEPRNRKAKLAQLITVRN